MGKRVLVCDSHDEFRGLYDVVFQRYVGMVYEGVQDYTEALKETWGEKETGRTFHLVVLRDERGFTEQKILPKVQSEMLIPYPAREFVVVTPCTHNVQGLVDEGLFKKRPTIVEIPFELEQFAKTIKGIFAPKGSGLLDKFFRCVDPQTKLGDAERDVLRKAIEPRLREAKGLDDVLIATENYSSKSGFCYGDMFIKVDVPWRLRKEHAVYATSLGGFDAFRPSMRGLVADDDAAILTLDNVLSRPHASVVFEAQYGDMLRRKGFVASDEHVRRLFLMGLFHKEASALLSIVGVVPYAGVHGLPHQEEGAVPYRNKSGVGYQRLRETEIDGARVAQTILRHIEGRRGSDAVIHGDWKCQNEANGYLVDYAMVGRGSEVDDITYCYSDADFGLSSDAFVPLLRKYVAMRRLHDDGFRARVDGGYCEVLRRQLYPSLLSQVVLRHSVMNKRDLADDRQYERRLFYRSLVEDVARACRV